MTRTMRITLATERNPSPGMQALAFGDHGQLLAVATTG